MRARCYDCDGPMTYSDEYDYQGWYCPRCADKEEEEETKREAEEEEEDNQ